MPPEEGDDDAPELPWVERRPIARLAAFGDKTDKPVITAKALREQKAVIIGRPEWPEHPTEQQKQYMGNIAKDFSVEWNPRQTAAARAVDKAFQNDASYEETDAAVEELMQSLVEQEKREYAAPAPEEEGRRAGGAGLHGLGLLRGFGRRLLGRCGRSARDAAAAC